MFELIRRLAALLTGKAGKLRKDPDTPIQIEEYSLSGNFQADLKQVYAVIGNSDDIIVREFKIGPDRVNAAMIYIDGLVDRVIINDEILKSLMILAASSDSIALARARAYASVKEQALTVGEVSEASKLDQLMLAVFSGDTVILVDGSTRGLITNTRGWQDRGVEQPKTESTIRGPRDSFNETLRTNTALVRRRVRDPNLVVQITRIGRRTKTDVAILYVKGIVDPGLLSEVKGRLDAIDMDRILGGGYIEQMIEDNWRSPFPQLQATERPDEMAAGILEGRVAILVDGSPFGVIIPATFNSLMLSPEDYYQRWITSSAVRLIRFLASFIALIFPSIYIAMTSFHPELIPTTLLFSLGSARLTVPYPAIVEAILMEIVIELFREASIRLPLQIGQAISVVGGLVIGQASIQAGIISPILLVVISVTAIGSFVVPSYELALSLRLLRFPLMLAAASFGLYGLVMGTMAVLVHLVKLESFGISYLAPWTPVTVSDFKDTIFKAPLPAMHKRPGYLNPQDVDRLTDRRQNRNLAGPNSDNT